MTRWIAWRTRAGLTQQQLAGMVGVERASVSNVEHGRRVPSLSLLRRLSDALNLSPEERLEAAGLGVERQAA